MGSVPDSTGGRSSRASGPSLLTLPGLSVSFLFGHGLRKEERLGVKDLRNHVGSPRPEVRVFGWTVYRYLVHYSRNSVVPIIHTFTRPSTDGTHHRVPRQDRHNTTLHDGVTKDRVDYTLAYTTQSRCNGE